MIKNNVIGLDLAKNIFHLVSFNAELKQIKKKVKRADLLSYIANLPVSIIGMEACGGSHYWAREIKKLGHEVVLLNARYVKGFVVGNKNDYNDAEAIWTATHRNRKDEQFRLRRLSSKIFKCCIDCVKVQWMNGRRWRIEFGVF